MMVNTSPQQLLNQPQRQPSLSGNLSQEGIAVLGSEAALIGQVVTEAAGELPVGRGKVQLAASASTGWAAEPPAYPAKVGVGGYEEDHRLNSLPIDLPGYIHRRSGII